MNDNCTECTKVVEFLDKLKCSIEKNGINKTVDMLNLQTKGNPDEIFELIIQTTLYEFNGLDKKELLKGVSRKDGVRFSALSIITSVAYDNQFKTDDIKKKLYKSKTAIMSYRKYINDLSETIPEHRKIIKKYCLIKDKIKQLI